jgi:polyphosphate kinase 2 (PPK2 family)
VEEQVKRLRKRVEDPLERWKMGLADVRNVKLRADYTAAIDEMLQRTSTPYAPWCVIAFEDKRFGRIAAIEHVVKTLSKGMDLKSPPLQREVAQAAAQLFAKSAAGGKGGKAAKK